MSRRQDRLYLRDDELRRRGRPLHGRARTQRLAMSSRGTPDVQCRHRAQCRHRPSSAGRRPPAPRPERHRRPSPSSRHGSRRRASTTTGTTCWMLAFTACSFSGHRTRSRSLGAAHLAELTPIIGLAAMALLTCRSAAGVPRDARARWHARLGAVILLHRAVLVLAGRLDARVHRLYVQDDRSFSLLMMNTLTSPSACGR